MNRYEPLSERHMGILEDRPHRDGELAIAVTAAQEPRASLTAFLDRYAVDVNRAALDATRASRPAEFLEDRAGLLVIRRNRGYVEESRGVRGSLRFPLGHVRLLLTT